jgi:hypothetical protein
MHPIFARIRPRLEGARRELRMLEEALRIQVPGTPDEVARWMRRSATAFAVTAIYTGLEGILRVIADDIDRHLPSGADRRAELLRAMSLELPGTRPRVLARTRRCSWTSCTSSGTSRGTTILSILPSKACSPTWSA